MTNKRKPIRLKRPPPRTRAPERTRSQLLNAARALFAMHGLHGVSVAEIALRAGVSTAMINHHFGGKLELYRACLQGFAEVRLRVIDKFLVAPKSPEEMRIRLEMLVAELLDVHLEHREIVAILLRDLGASDQWGDHVERTLYEFTPRFTRFFELAQKQKIIRNGVNPLTVASIIYLSLSGLLQADAHRARVTGFTLSDPVHRATVVQQLLDVTLHGIMAMG